MTDGDGTVDLHWANVPGTGRGPGWRRVLLAGDNPAPLAELERRAVHWAGAINLPGLEPRRPWAPKAEMEADVEERVRAWFASALR